MPSLVTVRTNRCSVKVAETDLASLMVTVHVVSETVSHPVQPANVEPIVAYAVKVTWEPFW
jgi:hypothetical protein